MYFSKYSIDLTAYRALGALVRPLRNIALTPEMKLSIPELPVNPQNCGFVPSQTSPESIVSINF